MLTIVDVNHKPDIHDVHPRLMCTTFFFFVNPRSQIRRSVLRRFCFVEVYKRNELLIAPRIDSIGIA